MTKKRSATTPAGESASELITQRIASLDDPSGLFNASLDGNVRRAIDVRDGEVIDAPALKALIRAAVALNTARAKPAPRADPPPRAQPTRSSR